jgi:hypothetical protein
MSTQPTSGPPPSSLPVTPAQPNQPYYGIASLQLFKTYNSAESFQAAFGVAPPPINQNYPPKYWFDSSLGGMDPEDVVTYTIAKFANGVWTIVQRAMLVIEATTINTPSGASGAAPSPWITEQAREVPIRPLITSGPSAESLSPNPFGLMIARADLVNAGQAADGGFTTNDRLLLTAIGQKLGVSL